PSRSRTQRSSARRPPPGPPRLECCSPATVQCPQAATTTANERLWRGYSGEISMHQTRPTLGSSSEDSPADFPLEELQKHRGRWVAFSADGRRLVASGVTLAEVDALVR